MGCKGSQVRILSPRPIKTSTYRFRNLRILLRGTTGGTSNSFQARANCDPPPGSCRETQRLSVGADRIDLKTASPRQDQAAIAEGLWQRYLAPPVENAQKSRAVQRKPHKLEGAPPGSARAARSQIMV